MRKVFFASVISLLIILSAVFFWLKTIAPEYHFAALMTANILMAALVTISFAVVTKKLDGSPNAFVRGVYSSTFLKLFVCIAAVLVYALANKPDVHKPTLFILFGIYAVYTVIETVLLSKITREQK